MCVHIRITKKKVIQRNQNICVQCAHISRIESKQKSHARTHRSQSLCAHIHHTLIIKTRSHAERNEHTRRAHAWYKDVPCKNTRILVYSGQRSTKTPFWIPYQNKTRGNTHNYHIETRAPHTRRVCLSQTKANKTHRIHIGAHTHIGKVRCVCV